MVSVKMTWDLSVLGALRIMPGCAFRMFQTAKMAVLSAFEIFALWRTEWNY